MIIINKIPKEIDRLSYLGDDTEKYITFKVPIKKEKKYGRSITLKLKFFNSLRIMNRSLSDLVDNLSEINKQECIKCKERTIGAVKGKNVRYVNNRLIYKCK